MTLETLNYLNNFRKHVRRYKNNMERNHQCYKLKEINQILEENQLTTDQIQDLETTSTQITN